MNGLNGKIVSDRENRDRTSANKLIQLKTLKFTKTKVM